MLDPLSKIMPFQFPRCACALFLLCAALALTPAAASAASAHISVSASPVGRWKTIDDHSGKAKSIVVIRQRNGILYGTIKRLFDPPVPHPRCIRCSGSRKNRSVLGMRILWGMRKDGNQWSGGEILDPENGDIYHCSIRVEDRGKVLRVHGYIGFPIFGRTQYWLRVAPKR